MERRITRKGEERKVETGNQYRTIECWRKKTTSVLMGKIKIESGNQKRKI